MAKYSIEDTTLADIADAIRAKEESSAAIPVADFATRISDIQTGVDTSADTVVADALTEGYTAHDAAGNLVNGANPYAKEDTNTTVNTQADLIAQIQTALEGKAAGGGVDSGNLQFLSATKSATGTSSSYRPTVTTTVALPDGVSIVKVLTATENYGTSSSSSAGKWGVPTIVEETNYSFDGTSLSVSSRATASTSYRGVRLSVIVFYTE